MVSGVPHFSYFKCTLSSHTYYYYIIIFLGNLSPPTDLTVSGFQNGRLALTWNFSSIPSVQALFTLTVLKNNSYSRQEERNTVQNITETAAMVEIDYSFCDVFYFWVMAENDAGESDMSTAAKWIPPYQPNFSALSLQHSLSRTAEGVFVTVAVNVLRIIITFKV